MIEGLTFYDSITHSFTTIATAGFSTNPNSIGAYQPIVQYTIVLFMIIAASSFSLHYLAIRRGRVEYFKDREFKVYISLLVLFVFIFFADNYSKYLFREGVFEEGFRNSLFTATSLLTTTVLQILITKLGVILHKQ